MKHSLPPSMEMPTAVSKKGDPPMKDQDLLAFDVVLTTKVKHSDSSRTMERLNVIVVAASIEDVLPTIKKQLGTSVVYSIEQCPTTFVLISDEEAPS